MKITDRVFMLDCTKGSYVYLIKGEENVLIDTGLPWKGKAIVRELEGLGATYQSIKHILLTHHDIDHIGSACMLQRLSGASLWASETDTSYIRGETPRPGFKKHLSKLFRVKKPESIRAFSDNEVISGVRVIMTPGHTPGHVCFIYDNVLLAGDLVENKKGSVIPYPAPWTVDPASLADSIRKVEEYDFDWVCPAHGAPFRRDSKRICTN